MYRDSCGGNKEERLFHLPRLLPPSYSCTVSTLLPQKCLYCSMQLHTLTNTLHCMFTWILLSIHNTWQSTVSGTLDVQIACASSSGQENRCHNNSVQIIHFTVANPTISKPRISLSSTPTTLVCSVCIPRSDWPMSPNESLKCPDRTALVKGSSRVLIC